MSMKLSKSEDRLTTTPGLVSWWVMVEFKVIFVANPTSVKVKLGRVDVVIGFVVKT